MPVDFECINEVLKKEGLSEEDKKDFIETLRENLKDPALSADNLQEIQKASQTAFAYTKENKIKALHREIRNENVVKNLKDKIVTYKEKYNASLADSYQAFIEEKRFEGYGGNSAFNVGNALSEYENAVFLANLRRQNINVKSLGRGANKKLNRDIFIELFTGNKGLTGNPEAVTAANEVRNSLERSRGNMRIAGVDMGYQQNYVPRIYDKYKISLIGQEQFSKDMFEWTNVKDIGAWNETYIDIVSGELRPTGSRSGTIGGRYTKERVIEFNSPEMEYQFAQKYGSGNIIESVLRYNEDLNYRAGVATVLGPDPKQNLISVLRDLYSEAVEKNDLLAVKEIRDIFDPNKSDFAEVGIGLKPNFGVSVNRLMKWNYLDDWQNKWNTGLASYKSYLNMVSLGSAGIKAAVDDLWTRAANLQLQGKNIWVTLGENVVNTLTPFTKEVKQDLLPYLAIELQGIHNFLSMYWERDSSPYVGKLIGGAEKLMFKMNGMNFITNKARAVQAKQMSHMYAKMAKNNEWRDIGDITRRFLNSYDINETNWGTVKRATITINEPTFFGKKPMDIEYISPEKIRAEDPELFLNLITMINREANSAVLHGSLTTQRQKTLNTNVKNGSMGYLIFDLGMQFKTFLLSYSNDFIHPMLNIAKRGGHYGMLGNMLASLFVVSYAGITIKDLIQGKTPRKLNKYKTWVDIFENTNMAGIFTSIIAKVLHWDEFNLYKLRTLLPPALSKPLDAADAIHAAFSGKKDVAIRKGLSLIPLNDIFFARTALNNIFLKQIYENENPRYMQRMYERMMDDYGQEMLFK